MHFWLLAARLYSRFSAPRKIGLNWFMPALEKRSVGSSTGTTGLLGTKVWPCFLTKKSMNCWRISLEVIGSVKKSFGLLTKRDQKQSERLRLKREDVKREASYLILRPSAIRCLIGRWLIRT